MPCLGIAKGHLLRIQSVIPLSKIWDETSLESGLLWQRASAKWILIGNLGKGPQVKYIRGGVPVAMFSPGTNERYKDTRLKLRTKISRFERRSSKPPLTPNVRLGSRIPPCPRFSADFKVERKLSKHRGLILSELTRCGHIDDNFC
jgi:hypothetical protein